MIFKGRTLRTTHLSCWWAGIQELPEALKKATLMTPGTRGQLAALRHATRNANRWPTRPKATKYLRGFNLYLSESRFNKLILGTYLKLFAYYF